MSVITQAGRLLEIETPLGKDALILTSLKGRESVSDLFHFELSLFSSNTDIVGKDLIGKPASFVIREGNKPRYFHGIINQFQSGALRFPLGRYYRVEVVPWLWFLTCTTDCRIYQNKTTTDIIVDVFKRFGFNDYSTKYLQAPQQARTYCVQYAETAFNFVSRLMEETGIFYFFKHEKNKHILMLADSMTAFEEITDTDINYVTGSYTDNTISHFEHENLFNTGKETRDFYDFERPTTKIQKSLTTLRGQGTMKDYEHYIFTSTYEATRGDDNRAKIAIESQDTFLEHIKGVSAYPCFQPGVKFNLKIPFEPALSKEKNTYALIEVVHEAEDKTHAADEPAKQAYTNQFSAQPYSTTYRPPIKTSKPNIAGLQTAVVVGPKGEEIYTDKYGRVKVQFHWDRLGKNDDKSSCFIRVAQISAGNLWGAQFIPRIGQEVVVSFLDGDPDQPLIIGAVYNGNQSPPFSLPTHATQSGIKTHSSKNGGQSEANELRFEDKKGEELLFMHAQKDCTRVVEHDDSLEVKNNQEIKIKKNRNITVAEGNESTTIKQGKRSITVESGDDVKKVSKGNCNTEVSIGKSTTKAGQAIELTVGACSIQMNTTSITLKAGQNSIKIDPSGVAIHGLTVDVKADTSLKAAGVITEVDGNGMLTLKGAITMIN